MNKLCRIKFIPFEKLRNLNAAIWIETTLELTQDLPFSSRSNTSYDHALERIASNSSSKDSYEDPYKALHEACDVAYIPFCDTYAYTRDSVYLRNEEEKLNKGINLFKNLVFIPSNLTYYPEALKSFYIYVHKITRKANS